MGAYLSRNLMSQVQIHLLPGGQTLNIEGGSALQDTLFVHGVEFPCGGRGRCKGCRIKVLQGHLAVTNEDRALLSPAEISQGWRLACRAKVVDSLQLELAQWEPSILSDNGAFHFTPRSGFGVAVDLGTTTLVAQLVDLWTGNVRAVRTALNPQARHGADIMSRIDFALQAGQIPLQTLIREEIGRMVRDLVAEGAVNPSDLQSVAIVGNTAMHNLFCGVPVEPLSHYPFDPTEDNLRTFNAAELGWEINTQVRFLPCLGGFVGSDILAGVLATGLPSSDALVALIDLGTNGEIVLGNRHRMLCASTAAGPAFEGARISAGMRASSGAVSEVWATDGTWQHRVLGNGPARGLCGSGLVDAVATGLDLGWIQASGRLAKSGPLAITPTVALTQQDIRELQLAKAAIAAGFRILLQQWGATASDVSRLYLAGAFGNYIRLTSAQRIGLLPFAAEKVEPSGNTALRGAKMALFTSDGTVDYSEVRSRIQHVSLSADEAFQNLFVDEMLFPG